MECNICPMDRRTVTDRLLVVLTGAVGAGKSMTAIALASHLRSLGRTAAVVDLDEVYCMVHQHEGFDEPAGWDAARRGAAALADSFFASGLKVVVVEGEFYTPDERRQLRDNLGSKVEEKYFTLLVSYEEALRRARGDSTREASRDPKFLKRLHDNFVKALPYLESASVLVRADDRTPEELAALMVDDVLAGACKGVRTI